MRILPFRRAAARQADFDAQDWSQQELADFYRAHRLLVENGAGIGIDRGLSDSGDPWAVFYDLATQDAFLHVARIERSCVLICDPLGIRLTASTIAELICTFESEVRRLLNLRTQGSAAIIMHPASRIIMSISAVFLLFKFENAAAFHMKGADMSPGGDFLTRKIDAGILARIQSVVARLYDSMEAPAAVAALAGVILSAELAGLTSRHPGQQEAQDEHHAVHLPEPSHEQARIVENGSDVAQLHHGEMADTVVVHAKQVDPSGLIEVAADTKAPPMSAPEATLHKAAHMVAGGDAAPPAADNDQAPVASLVKATATLLIATGQPVVIEGDSPSQTQAFIAVQSLASDMSFEGGHDFLAKSQPALSLPGPDHGAPDPQADGFGFSYTTAMTGLPLLETLSEFISTLGGYDVEVHGHSVMIEQDDVETLNRKDIGIWTNLMPDGSDISVIGHASLVHEVVGMFA